MATSMWTRTMTTKKIGRSKAFRPPRAHLGQIGAHGPLRSAENLGRCDARPSCSRPSCSPNSRMWLQHFASRSFTTNWASHEAQNTQASPTPKSLPVIRSTYAVPAGICINSSVFSLMFSPSSGQFSLAAGMIGMPIAQSCELCWSCKRFICGHSIEVQPFIYAAPLHPPQATTF